jgi:hypothetical protein
MPNENQRPKAQNTKQGAKTDILLINNYSPMMGEN